MINEKNNTNSTLEKALDILKYFTSECPVRGLSEISRISSIPKATVYRFFNTFEKSGFLEKVDVTGKQNQYRLGMKFFELGSIVADSIELKEIALPYMTKLRDELNEDIHLIIRDKNQALCVEKLTCNHPVRLFTKIGRVTSLTAGACARAILSFLDDEEIDKILQEDCFEKYTENTIVDKEELLNSIKESRKKGVIVSFGELELQTVSIASPIFNHSGKAIASISVAGPEQRFNKEILEKCEEAVKRYARDISAMLGYKYKG